MHCGLVQQVHICYRDTSKATETAIKLEMKIEASCPVALSMNQPGEGADGTPRKQRWRQPSGRGQRSTVPLLAAARVPGSPMLGAQLGLPAPATSRNNMYEK